MVQITGLNGSELGPGSYYGKSTTNEKLAENTQGSRRILDQRSHRQMMTQLSDASISWRTTVRAVLGNLRSHGSIRPPEHSSRTVQKSVPLSQNTSERVASASLSLQDPWRLLQILLSQDLTRSLSVIKTEADEIGRQLPQKQVELLSQSTSASYREASQCTATCRVEAFWLHWGSLRTGVLRIPSEFSCQQALVRFACQVDAKQKHVKCVGCNTPGVKI